MVSFAPLLEPSFPVSVREPPPPQTGNFAHALSNRTMASDAGRNVGIWNSLLIDRSSCGDALPISVIGGLRG